MYYALWGCIYNLDQHNSSWGSPIPLPCLQQWLNSLCKLKCHVLLNDCHFIFPSILLRSNIGDNTKKGQELRFWRVLPWYQIIYVLLNQRSCWKTIDIRAFDKTWSACNKSYLLYTYRCLQYSHACYRTSFLE